MNIHTERLLLRNLTLDDAVALNEIERDPVVTRYMTFDPQTLDQTRTYIEADLKLQSAKPRHIYDLAIVQEGRLIGRSGLGVRRPEHFEAEVWYELSPLHWGKGYAYEAASALVDFAFGTLGLHRVWADSDPRNTNSCRIIERLGMTLEGRIRENYLLKGEWCNTALYGMLDRDWRALRQRP